MLSRLGVSDLSITARTVLVWNDMLVDYFKDVIHLELNVSAQISWSGEFFITLIWSESESESSFSPVIKNCGSKKRFPLLRGSIMKTWLAIKMN